MNLKDLKQLYIQELKEAENFQQKVTKLRKSMELSPFAYASAILMTARAIKELQPELYQRVTELIGLIDNRGEQNAETKETIQAE